MRIKILVPGGIDKVDDAVVAFQESKSQHDGKAAALFFLQPVCVGARYRLYECGLAVVDMTEYANGQLFIGQLAVGQARALDSRVQVFDLIRKHGAQVEHKRVVGNATNDGGAVRSEDLRDFFRAVFFALDLDDAGGQFVHRGGSATDIAGAVLESCAYGFEFAVISSTRRWRVS